MGLRFIILGFAIWNGVAPSIAETLQQQKAALKVISSAAGDICQGTPLETTRENVELTTSARAKLSGTIRKVVDAGISGAATFNQTRSKGILEKDLASAIRDGNYCRRNVFNVLVPRMLPSHPTAPLTGSGGQPAKRSAPHRVAHPPIEVGPESATVAGRPNVPTTGITCSVEGLIRSVASRTPGRITFTNRSLSPVVIYWLNFGGERVSYGTLASQSVRTFDSYVNHVWLVSNMRGSCFGIWMAGDQVVVQ